MPSAKLIDPIAAAAETELKRRAWSIRELAKLSGVNHPTISRWMSGARVAIRLDQRTAILKALGLEIVVRRIRA
jgi:transcriptional regulator with XRE-family HTH domain